MPNMLTISTKQKKQIINLIVLHSTHTDVHKEPFFRAFSPKEQKKYYVNKIKKKEQT
jgi:hypothetical protein